MEELHKAKCILFSKNKKNQIIYMFKSLLKMSYVYSLTGCGMREKMEAVCGMTEILMAGCGIKNTLEEAGFTQFDPWDAEEF